MAGKIKQAKDAPSVWVHFWREMFGEPPPLADDPELLSRVMIDSLPPAPPYQPVDFRMIHRRPEPPRSPDSVGDEDEARSA